MTNKGHPKSSFFRQSLHLYTPCDNYGFLWWVDILTDTYRLRRYLNDDLDTIFEKAFANYDQLVEGLSIAIDLPLYDGRK